MLSKTRNRTVRAARTRSKFAGSAARPRLSVFRSNARISVQAIDDASGKTLAAASDLKIDQGTKTERAALVGKTFGEALSKLGVKEAVFDRGGYKYHGRVKALAEAVRAAGIQF